MSGLEVVIRPVVLPNIRPTAPRVVSVAAVESQGTTNGGSGGKLIDLTYHFESSLQRQPNHYETERTFDVDRVYQKNADGSINKDNHVTVERVTQIKSDGSSTTTTTTKGPTGWGPPSTQKMNYARPPEQDNVETIQRDQVRRVEEP
jgi:hypothetical protein